MTKVVQPTMAELSDCLATQPRICVVAHSTGCLISMHVAARHPDWFHSITLSSPFFRLKDHRRIFGNLDLMKIPFMLMSSAFKIRPFMGQEIIPTEDMVLDGKHKMSHNRVRSAWWHEIRTTKNPSGCAAAVITWHWLNQAIHCYTALPNVLPLVKCPVAIVPADDEVLVSNEATYELASLLPDCTIIRPGTGCFHEIWMEDDDSRLLLRDVCVNNCRRGLERKWDRHVLEHVVYRSKGSTTLKQDRAHALRSVSLWRLAGGTVVISWLVRFLLIRIRHILAPRLLQGRKQFILVAATLVALAYSRKRL